MGIRFTRLARCAACVCAVASLGASPQVAFGKPSRRPSRPSVQVQTIAIFPFGVNGTTRQKILKKLAGEVRKQAAKRGYKMLDGKDLQRRLGVDPAKAIARCGTDPGCAADLGRHAQTELVMTGQAAPASNGVQIFLSLVDVKASSIVNSVFLSLANEGSVRADMRELADLFVARELEDPAFPPVAALESAAGADPLAPLPPDPSNAAALSSIEPTSDVDSSQTVAQEVLAPQMADEAYNATLPPLPFLDEDPPPPASHVGPLKVSGLVLLGLGLLGGGAGGYVGLGVRSEQKGFDRTRLTQIEVRDRTAEINGHARLANIIYVGAAATALIGAGCLIVDVLSGRTSSARADYADDIAQAGAFVW